MLTLLGHPIARAAALLAGTLAALLPGYGPFVALLATFSVRWHLRRSDGIWWLAALLLALPWIASGHVVAGALSGAQILAAWLLFRGAEEARRTVRTSRLRRDVGVGLLIGLVGVTLSGLARIEGINLEAIARVSQLVAWREHPTLFGHSVLTVSALVALALAPLRVSALALAIGAIGVLATGALEVVAAWLLVSTVMALRAGRPGSRRLHLLVLGSVALLIVAGGERLGLGRAGFLVDLEREPSAPNLLQGTEVAGGAWWHSLDVDVAIGSARLDGLELVTYTLTKRGEQGWARLQQRARLDPGEVTVSVYLQPVAGTRPGIDLWGRVGSSVEASDFNVYATIREDGSWRGSERGALTLVDARLIDVDEAANADGWVRGAITVSYDGPTTDWYVGVTPDRSRGALGSSTTFAGLQLDRGREVGTYVPGPTERGLDLRTARLPVWGDAVAAIEASPWYGWGPQGYRRALEVLRPDELSQRALPSHAHNAFLDAWVERGALGFVALVLLVAALLARALRARDGVTIAIVVAVLVMNAFDTSLLYGGVLYPMALLLGWRAGAASEPDRASNLRSQTPARLVLALGDVTAAWLAAGVSALLGRWFDGRFGFQAEWALEGSTLAYVLLLWPLLMVREGLYPGYGTSPANELRKSVQAAFTAGVVAVLGTQLLPEVLGMPLANALVLALAATLLAPLVRGSAKRLLLALGAWGKPVLVIGSGTAAVRVTRTLRRRALDGLWPVGVFSDDPHLGATEGDANRAQQIDGVPVIGGVAAAGDHARRIGVDHAIVVLPQSQPEALQALVGHLTRDFQRVQFIPNLATMPSHGVYATELDHMLALELRVGLLDPTNRTIKRVLDLSAVLLAAVLVLPVTLLIALAIRLDAPGPALYTQERIGRGGRRFRVWKFRTMVVDADEALLRLLADDPAARAEWAQRQKLKHDPRITRVGRWLRRTSLDELPQLWNVLRGEMSLVGPRPIVAEEVRHYGDAFELFCAVPPGISGHWQVSGRSRVPYPERVEYDVYYVRNWSVWLDAVILARTVAVVLRRDGAF